MLSTSPPASCNPTYLNYADVPAPYNTSTTPYCGISYPSALLPQSNFSGEPSLNPSTSGVRCTGASRRRSTDHPTACCAANVSTSNSCFQYCSPKGEWDTVFSDCLYANVMNSTESLEVWCNPVAQGRHLSEGTKLFPGLDRGVWKVAGALLAVAVVNVML